MSLTPRGSIDPPENAHPNVKADPPKTRDECEQARWESFVAERTWTFARTYVDRHPHEWAHAAANSDGEFLWAVDHLNRHEKIERFWGWERPYFTFSGPHGTHTYSTREPPQTRPRSSTAAF